MTVLNWKPRKWLALLLAFVFSPLGMLYVNRPGWALAWLLLLPPVAALQFWLLATGRPWPLSLAFVLVSMAQVWFFAARTKGLPRRPLPARWYSLLGAALVTGLGILSFRAFVAEPFNVPAASMYPTLSVGTQLVVRKWGYGNYASLGLRIGRGAVSAPLERGGIYVFEYPQDRNVDFVKRLVGLPGDRIVYKDKRLTVNGRMPVYAQVGEGSYRSASGRSEPVQLWREDGHRIGLEAASPARDLVDIVVKPGELYFLGDNRDNSSDSRLWGSVPLDHVVGRVVLVLDERGVRKP